ncbi:MAG TPA: hypothetical protein VGM88_26090 [Kofleriaceae bacterium]
MRSAILALLCLAAPAAADPLWDAELRGGYGLSTGGGGTMTSRRPTPLTLTAIVSVAINDSPPLSAFGGAVIETLQRNSVGATGGILFQPHGGPWRLSAGGEYVFEPYTLWGGTAAVGYCKHASPSVKLCGDAQLTAFFTGTDLAPGHTVTEVQLALGVVFGGQ